MEATACGFESGFEIALLKLLDGDASGAATEMRGLIEADLWSCQTKRGQAWAQYAIASAQSGDPDSARFALGKLADDPELVSTPAFNSSSSPPAPNWKWPRAIGLCGLAISCRRRRQPGTGRSARRGANPLPSRARAADRG